ncbi:MAG: zinc-binding dehydrogenase [Candidatus Melainabacteria bacterium]|nr:zinc-binding dehydrogenase [Candidatus Melainabacteria bacterium]
MALHLVKEKENFINEESVEQIPELMNACLFYGPHDIRYEKVPTPKIRDNEILVKVKVALTCGTDLKTFQRSHPILIKSTPSTFGHQFSGVIEKVGRNVKNFSTGQRVVALNSTPCYKCGFCAKEKFSLCENLSFLNGAYAEYIAVPADIVQYNTYQIPDNISFEAAASLEGLSVVVHGLERSQVTSDKTVCIIGTGSIGLMFCAIAKLNGAKVISLGRNAFKLELAEKLGADHILNIEELSEQELIEKIKYLTDGNGPEIVIEAVGLPETWELATKLVSKGGLVNFFGGCKKGSKVELDTYRIHYDELKLIGVFHHTPKHVKIALNLLNNTNFQEKISEKIITHTVPLRELEKAFLMHKSGQAIQVAVKP